ncbi:MAG: rubrerythrin family protein [Sedimentisphaerales bacterium]|nr:rubrerythrin family protein [Sedimentisphaerales bacterium]
MKRLVGILTIVVCFLPGSVRGGRYIAAQYPETTAVLQVLYGNEIRKEHHFLSYAEKADIESSDKMTYLFAALAKSESVLAENHRLLLTEFDMEAEASYANGASIADTRHNLEILANIGLAKVDDRYSVFMNMIRTERNEEAISLVQQAWDIKKRQYEIVKKGLDATGLLGLVSKAPENYYVCTMCGYIETEAPGQRCPMCAADAQYLEQVGDEWRVYLGIMENSQLDNAEKAYARRFFDKISIASMGFRMASDPSVFGSDEYEKWGLGAQREFSVEEKAYINTIEEMALAWKTYNEIDMNDLNDMEKEYIEKMHSRYGDGDIDLSARRIAGEFSQAMVHLLNVSEALSGISTLSDADIVFVKRSLSN